MEDHCQLLKSGRRVTSLAQVTNGKKAVPWPHTNSRNQASSLHHISHPSRTWKRAMCYLRARIKEWNACSHHFRSSRRVMPLRWAIPQIIAIPLLPCLPQMQCIQLLRMTHTFLLEQARNTSSYLPSSPPSQHHWWHANQTLSRTFQILLSPTTCRMNN